MSFNKQNRILLIANTDWYMFNFNLSIALKLRDEGFAVLLACPTGPYFDRLSQLGFSCFEAPMKRGPFNLVSELFLMRWLYRLVLVQRPDVIHAFTIRCAFYCSLINIFKKSKLLVLTLSGLGYVFTNRSIKASLLKFFLFPTLRLLFVKENVRLIVMNSDDIEFVTARLHMPNENVKFVPGAGVDCKKFHPYQCNGKNNTFTVLLPARILMDKGVYEYVEAARYIISNGYNIKFLLAGSPDNGNPSSIPESVISSWRAEGVIDYLNHVDNMPRLYNSVDLVVLPSYREGLPTGLTEASACCLPVIATDVPGCRDAVVDGFNGYLIPVKDSIALAEAIIKLFDNEQLCAQFGKNGRARVLETYEMSIIVDSIIKIYLQY